MPALVRRLAALASMGTADPRPIWDCILAGWVGRAITDSGLGCVVICMEEAGVRECVCIIGISEGGAPVGWDNGCWLAGF